MKYIRQYLEDELFISPLGELTLGETEIIPSCEYSGQEIIINGKYTGIYVTHTDYANWIEKKYAALKLI